MLISHWEMRNKTTLSCLYITNILAKMKKIILNVGWDVKQLEFPYTAERDVNYYNHFEKLAISTKAEHT